MKSTQACVPRVLSAVTGLNVTENVTVRRMRSATDTAGIASTVEMGTGVYDVTADVRTKCRVVEHVIGLHQSVRRARLAAGGNTATILHRV